MGSRLRNHTPTDLQPAKSDCPASTGGKKAVLLVGYRLIPVWGIWRKKATRPGLVGARPSRRSERRGTLKEIRRGRLLPQMTTPHHEAMFTICQSNVLLCTKKCTQMTSSICSCLQASRFFLQRTGEVLTAW